MQKINFKNISLVFIIFLIILLILRSILVFSFFYIIIPTIIYLIFIFLGAKNICSQFFLKSICKSEDKSKLHLTFDDGPHPVVTPKILKVLKKNNESALFFCIGKNIEKYPDVAKQIVEEGHEIANHSYSHSNFFDFFKSSKVISELKKTNELIKNITGTKCIKFRPPFGITNPHIAKAINKLDMQVVGWNIRSFDTIKGKKEVLKRIENAKKGDIILFHDTKEQTVEILDEFLRLK